MFAGFREDDLEMRAVAVAGREVRLRAPRAPDRLLDRIDPEGLARDERMPYWAELWPAARALAAHALGGAAGVAGEDVLELGAGLGLGGVAAGLAGALSVTFTDYFEEALAFAAENARLNGLARYETALLDWRRPALGRRFRVVIGSDLLYEDRNHAPVADTLAAALADGGTAWLAEPERRTAAGFMGIAGGRGLDVERVARVEVAKAGVTLLRATWAGGRVR
jgi:predicted nicotinamide N-methyase